MKKVKQVFETVARIAVVILLLVVTFSYAMFQGGFVSWFLFYTLLPFLLYSFLLFFFPIQIKDVHRKVLPKKLIKGGSATVTVSFKNKSIFPFMFLTVKELGLCSRGDKSYSNIFFVGWKREFEWTYEVPDLQRGEIKFSTIQFIFSDFFGWIMKEKNVDVNETFIVYPKIYDVQYQQLKTYFDQGGTLETKSLMKDTSMVTGVRDYQSGDKFSWIHWKSFAKNETLRTKDFEEQESQDILLVVDGTSKQHFEEVIELAASILQSVVKNHGNISYLFVAREGKYIPNIKSQTQLAQVMNHLAVVEADEEDQIDQLLAREMKRMNGTVFFITGDKTEALEKIIFQHSKWMKGCYCFVLTDEEGKMKNGTKQSINVKTIHITKRKFSKVFTEVLKP